LAFLFTFLLGRIRVASADLLEDAMARRVEPQTDPLSPGCARHHSFLVFIEAFVFAWGDGSGVWLQDESALLHGAALPGPSLLLYGTMEDH
jgi:hypothetical protein